MDVDAINLSPLNALINCDLTKFCIGGVKDCNPLFRHINVGLDKSDIYINAGLILWNMDYCRNYRITDKLINFVKTRKGYVDAMDQGAINGVLKGLIKPIHPQFNVITAYFQFNSHSISKFYQVDTYSDEEISEARQNPVFVHFTPNLTTRPWQEHCRHPLKEKYWFYRNIIERKNMQLDKDMRSMKLKIISLLFYSLPFRYFNFIIKMIHKR